MPERKTVLLATAGHIDHGKTALLKALTGTDADRLPEEKKRGITIDIGFAHWEPEGGNTVFSFIDVPGHEAFVKNMLAGIAGVDGVVLVVAADESIMPQTVEHFRIAQMVGLSRGLVVLTKTGLAEPDMVELVREEIQGFVEGTFLESAPVLAVDSLSGEGIGALRQALLDFTRGISSRSTEGAFRLPADRIFTIKGFGTVVTGTAFGGCVSPNQTLRLLPQNKELRVRGVEVHGAAADIARNGERTALNLQGAGVSDIQRGNWLTSSPDWNPGTRLDAAISLLPDAPEMKNQARVRFHHGAQEVMGRVRLFDKKSLRGGEVAAVRISLEAPTLTLAGDRFILRRYSPLATIGGGVVIDPHPPRQARKEADLLGLIHIEKQGEIQALSLKLDHWLPYLIQETGTKGKPIQEILAKSSGIRENIVQEATKADNTLAGARLFSSNALEELLAQMEADVTSYHQVNPLRAAMPKDALASELKLERDVLEDLIKRLAERGKLEQAGDGVRHASFSGTLSDKDKKTKHDVENQFLKGGLCPSKPDDVLAPLGEKGREFFLLLQREGILIRIEAKFVIHKDTFDDMVRALRETSETGVIGISDFKDRFGLTRKHAIPLLEYLDRNAITRRRADGSRQILDFDKK